MPPALQRFGQLGSSDQVRNTLAGYAPGLTLTLEFSNRCLAIKSTCFLVDLQTALSEPQRECHALLEWEEAGHLLLEFISQIVGNGSHRITFAGATSPLR